jgi:hypothetical protein
MNFYQLKNVLNFPHLCGAIVRKSDVFALLQLNLDECSGITHDIEVLQLNSSSEHCRPPAMAIGRLQRVLALHEEDVDTINRYISEHKMTE